MDKPKKSDPVEQVHFRVDEVVRQMGVLARAMESLLREKVGKIESQETDKRTLAEVATSIHSLCGRLDALIGQMERPVTRESTVQLPSGQMAHMTVKETKQ